MSDQEPAKVVSLKCRNQKCDSIKATEIPYPAGTRMYRCAKCGYSWAVDVGGKFDVRRI